MDSQQGNELTHHFIEIDVKSSTGEASRLPDGTPVTPLRYSIALVERECSERDLLLNTQL